MKRGKDKVCIVGFSPNTLGMVPFEDDSFDFWGLNELYLEVPKSRFNNWTAWFEMHDLEHIQRSIRNPGHFKWVQQFNGPVIMKKAYKEIPKSIKYPLKKLTEKFGVDLTNGNKRAYITNSITFMLLLAMDLGYKEIHIYGVDMQSDGKDQEYSYQRPNCEYYIGMARGLGIKVVLPRDSD